MGCTGKASCSLNPGVTKGENMEKTLNAFPFRTVLSFEPLFAYLKQRVESVDETVNFNKKRIQALLDRSRDLNGQITDPDRLKASDERVNRLMSTVFSPISWETEAVGAVIPLTIEPFFVSPRFERLFLDKRGTFQGRINVGTRRFNQGRIIRAYLLILERFYGIRQRLDYPLVRIIKDPETGLDRHFRMQLDFRFVEVHPLTSPRVLSDEAREMVLEHLTQPEKLREIIPPENFELRGFTVIRAVEVTASEVISALERDLIDQDSITSQKGFLALQQHLRTLFRRPDLVATLAGIQDDQALLLNSGSEMTHRCIFSDSRHVPLSTFAGSRIERVINDREIVKIADISKGHPAGEFKYETAKLEIRSCLIGPLSYKNQCIGILNLGSPRAGDLGGMDALLMEQILPIFSLAIKKSLDELEHQIQNVIRENCTAIHPAVEWRFRKAAIRYLDAKRKEGKAEIEPIIFKDVYPLYGVSDIRGSSEERNRAIQKDLINHLNLGYDVIRQARKVHALPILEELNSRIEAFIEKVQGGLATGDDLAVVKFMRDEVEPFFYQADGFGDQVAAAIEAYQAAIDRKSGSIYRLRRDFEESFSIVSQQLATYLDEEEASAQAIYPHYFERHETDGVDYLIYLGESLVEDGGFHDIYLKNLRLWQLKVACGMARRVDKLKTTLKVPLDIAQLILVQNVPLSIRFRYDEKHFSVDGAYDIRHAIIKSRLDKAVVRGTGERLTQPGKIAVVYSHVDEADEMARHICFLQSEGYLTGDVEKLDIEDLPGVPGLMSIRVGVVLEPESARNNG